MKKIKKARTQRRPEVGAGIRSFRLLDDCRDPTQLPGTLALDQVHEGQLSWPGCRSGCQPKRHTGWSILKTSVIQYFYFTSMSVERIVQQLEEQQESDRKCKHLEPSIDERDLKIDDGGQQRCFFLDVKYEYTDQLVGSLSSSRFCHLQGGGGFGAGRCTQTPYTPWRRTKTTKNWRNGKFYKFISILKAPPHAPSQLLVAITKAVPIFVCCIFALHFSPISRFIMNPGLLALYYHG